MKRISLSKRELLLVLVLAVAVLVYVYLNFLLLPSYERINQLRDELQQKKRIALNKDAAIKKLAGLDRMLEQDQLRLKAIEKKIPYNVRLPELVVNIDGKVKEIGMDIKSISVGEVDQANKEYGVIPVNVALEGKYDGILEFIKYIEGNERKYIIDSFVLSPLKRAEPIPFSISMRTFILKDSKDSKRPEQSDYPFFKHKNGKSYPFLESEEIPGALDNDINKEMEKKYDELDDIIKGMSEGTIPEINEIGEGN